MTSFYLNNSLIESPLFILIIASAKTSATETISSLLNILLFDISIVSLTIILSIGGTDFDQLELILKILKDKKVVVLQCTSIYPCPTDKINLKVMNTLKERFTIPVGFSSHHTSPMIPAMSVAFGAKVTEVHVTLDIAMWGTDQAMSLEPRGMQVMINAIKDFELAMGTGHKQVSVAEQKTLSRTVGR